jgi:hypothetical protein
MAQLSGMKAIAGYMNRSEATTLVLIRDYDMPAWKAGGIWESDTELVDKWRRDRINAAKTGNGEKHSKKGKKASTRAKKERVSK